MSLVGASSSSNEDFGPWLVETERLFAAMDTLDGDRKRGLLLVQQTDG